MQRSRSSLYWCCSQTSSSERLFPPSYSQPSTFLLSYSVSISPLESSFFPLNNSRFAFTHFSLVLNPSNQFCSPTPPYSLLLVTRPQIPHRPLVPQCCYVLLLGLTPLRCPQSTRLPCLPLPTLSPSFPGLLLFLYALIP